MPALSIAVPFPVFEDRDGQPLENGYVFIGVANLEPRTNPEPVFFDSALTIPAPQPLRTINGFISRSGTPAQVYVDGTDFSILVQDSRGTQVYSFAEGTGISPNASGVIYDPAVTSLFPQTPISIATALDEITGIGTGSTLIGFTGFKDQEATVQDLAENDGSDLVGFEPSAVGSIARSAQDKMRDNLSIKDFGGIGDGVVINNSAFNLMASAYGYVVFSEGDFLLNTQTIDVPLYFGAGAAITVPTGNTVTIRNRITSSNKQQIFKGDGNIRFENDNALGIGEDSRHVFAAWFGIFPVGQAAIIQTALFNKALGAFTSQTREGIFELDIGSYRIDGKVTIPRGIHLKGAGTRRTVFDLVNDGYTALESGGPAVKITGVQFEQPTGSFSYFDGTEIAFLHDTCTLDDVRLWNCRTGIFLGPDATRSTIKAVVCVNNSEPFGGYPANSAVIWVQATNVLIEDVQLTNTSFGQDCVVLVGFGNTSPMQNTIINDVGCTEKSTPIKIIADTSNIQNTAICNVVFFGSTGDDIDALIEVETSGTASVQGLSMNNVCSNSLASALLKMTQGSSGSTLAVTLASGTAFSANTQAANLTQTAGVMSKIVIAHGVAAFSATPPVSSSGTITDLEIASYM